MFVKGKSGNPNGRPKGSVDAVAVISLFSSESPPDRFIENNGLTMTKKMPQKQRKMNPKSLANLTAPNFLLTEKITGTRNHS